MSVEKPIITISHEDDAHLPFVQQHLDHPLVVIDPAAVTCGSDKELSYEFHAGTARLSYGESDVTDAQSVWYRKPRSLEKSELGVGDKYKDYSFSALQKHIAQLRAQLPEALWVSDYYAIQRANNKTLQLQTAYDLGMLVPDTLITSSPEAARQFLDEYSVSIVKTLATSFTTGEADEPLAFFAHKIHRGEHVDLTGLRWAPAVFQEAIDAEVDVRVTVVGDKAFPAIITTSGIENLAVRDWRIAHFEGSLDIEACNDLPSFITNACVEHVRRLGLQYGAVDLVIDKDHAIWFLENNPNGQWAFVEQYTGQPIGAAIAELLSRPTNGR